MRIEIEMKDETYEKIKNVIDWINLDNSFRGKSDTPEAKIEDFIKGAAISKLLDVESMSPLLNSKVEDGLEIKNRFKAIAKEKKIKQIDICKRTGLKKANLSLIFNNEKTLRADTFFAIWLTLGCPPIHDCLYIKKSD
ncbi:helix-turn-helix domain-containing protein [Oceanobacillus sp. FSL K6-2867]|uniref:helix-turn-helix domain-containing protein n=1 Tax=Oceanobacillus sp. FSL K6-2867 TaxID=2954748 RepID=UPI0030D92880